MSAFWLNRRRRDEELDEEIRTHLEMSIRDRIARGESPEEAARSARREFGDVTTVREVTSDMWSGQSIERLIQDVRWAVRGLLRSPAFTLLAVFTLALGIGANSAIFSVLNGVLLEPLPFPHPEQLVYITSQFPKLGFDQFPVDAAEFLEFRERNRSFQDVGAYVTSSVNIGGDGQQPARVTTGVASASLFKTLAVRRSTAVRSRWRRRCLTPPPSPYSPTSSGRATLAPIGPSSENRSMSTAPRRLLSA